MDIDWISPASIDAQNSATQRTETSLFGIMLWELVVTVWFDTLVITRKKPFKWPMIVYGFCKYMTFWFIVSVNIATFQVKKVPFNCQALGDFTDLTARIAMACASLLLMLRAIALWERDRRVVVPLVVLHLGQWGLYLHNVFIVKEEWGGTPVPTCQLLTVTWPWLKIQFIYTMVFDFIVLALVCWALLRLPGLSSLWKLLFIDGLSYFVVAFVCYLACTILAYLQVSIYLSFMFSDTATVLTSIAACRSYVRICTHPAHQSSTESESLPQVSTNIAFRVSNKIKSAFSGSGGTVSTKSREDLDLPTFNKSVPNGLHSTHDGKAVDFKESGSLDLEARGAKQ